MWYSRNSSSMSPVLWPIHWQICCGTQLISPNVLELLVLLAESEVGVGGHDAVVLSKVLQLYWTRRLDDRVRKADLQRGTVKTGVYLKDEFQYRVSLGPSHGSPHVVAGRLSAVATVEFPQHDKGDQDEDEQDDRHGDSHLD